MLNFFFAYVEEYIELSTEEWNVRNIVKKHLIKLLSYHKLIRSREPPLDRSNLGMRTPKKIMPKQPSS